MGASLTPAEEISMDAAEAAVISELNGSFTLKEQPVWLTLGFFFLFTY